jgi:putative transport protein
LVIAYALAISLGVRLGKIKFGGIALGVTFVLFVGILVGHISSTFFGIDYKTAAGGATMAGTPQIIKFVMELGLILFVYCIGLQVGPSFFATFKSGGLKMNMLAVGIVTLNIAMVFLLYYLFFNNGQKSDFPMLVGVLYGAVTNTPGLGAATTTVNSFFEAGTAPDIASGYACAYPLGVVGIILATIAIRYICKIDLDKEREQLRKEVESNPHATPKHLVLKVTNYAVINKTLEELRNFLNREFIVSRIIKGEELIIPNRDTKLALGDVVHLVCTEWEAQAMTELIGEAVEGKAWDADTEKKNYVSRRLMVTKEAMNGKTFGQLHFSSVYGVNVTRVTRNGMDLFANRNLRLQVGDRLLVTGLEENVDRLARKVGANVKHLDHPNVGAIFFGILLGIVLGQMPIPLPGIDVPVKLGYAGGPLIVAILVGAFGYRYKIASYMTTSANLMLREVGLILFLASVGLQAGATFWQTIVGGGYNYVWAGFLITTVPILIIGTIGRLKYKINYFTLMGLIAGSNTDPPALAFANQTATGSDAPAVGYSTVYPLTMFLRILTAQLVLLFFMG